MAMPTTVFVVLAGVLALNSVASSRYGTVNFPEKLNFIDLDLLKGVGESHSGNVLISPASVKTLLGLLLEGADNTTAQQIRFALRLDNDENARAQLHKFQLSLKPDGLTSTTLQVANRLFLSDKIKAKPSYQKVLHDNYDADLTNVTMSRTEETANTINQWVNQTTNGLIPSLVESDSLDPKAILVLTNAIFFRGLWEIAFEARNTGIYCFKVNSQCRRTRMMETVGFFRYASKDFGQILEMEYKDKRYSMVIVLPHQDNGVDAILRDIQHIGLYPALKELSKTEIWVTLPRFAIEFNADLVDTLKELGITDVFGPQSDLSKMVETDVPPVVSKVFHKAKIQVNEEGATAGAVSGALVVPLMGNPLPRFAATHPFLFFIRDVQTNSFLFAGRLSVPEDSEAPSSSSSPSESAPPPKQPSSFQSSSAPASPSSPPSSSSFLPRPRPRPVRPSSVHTTTATTTEEPTTTPGGIPLETPNSHSRHNVQKLSHYSSRPTHPGSVIDE